MGVSFSHLIIPLRQVQPKSLIKPVHSRYNHVNVINLLRS